jgi:hypothetical protein
MEDTMSEVLKREEASEEDLTATVFFNTHAQKDERDVLQRPGLERSGDEG